jgi:hypothetical protein
MSHAVPVTLHPWYYLDNFQFVLHWVHTRYDDILSLDERGFIAAFFRLERPSRALLVRLVMRKGNLFRTSKLHYLEIGNIDQAAQALIAHGWLDAQPKLTLDELFQLLTKSELAAIFRDQSAYALVSTCTKAKQLDALRPQFPSALNYCQWHDVGSAAPTTPSQADIVYRVAISATCDRIRLMFFGNLRQDWTEFVLADLGHLTYEKVDFPTCARAFQTPDDIDAYLRLSECKAQFASAPPECIPEIQAQIPSRYANEWLEARRSKLLFQIGQTHERHANWPGALACYEDSLAPGARARRIRVLERSGQHAAALALATTALQSPESEAEYQQVTRIMARLRRRIHGRDPVKSTDHPFIGRDRLVLSRPAAFTRVEHVVLQHLHRPNAPVFYTENALFNSLFGLLFWDTIFSAVPGAFFHPYQFGPADLHHPQFRRRREPAFSALFGQLDTGQYKETILRNAHIKAGIQSPFVVWGAIGGGLLEMALACIPAAHLNVIFKRLANDVRSNRAGMPDLIQLWPVENRYQMVEVKGPGDRLQDNQRRWLAFCHEHNLPIRVCHVAYDDTP